MVLSLVLSLMMWHCFLGCKKTFGAKMLFISSMFHLFLITILLLLFRFGNVKS